MGPNGAGKSTLGYVLMGNPKISDHRMETSFLRERILQRKAGR